MLDRRDVALLGCACDARVANGYETNIGFAGRGAHLQTLDRRSFGVGVDRRLDIRVDETHRGHNGGSVVACAGTERQSYDTCGANFEEFHGNSPYMVIRVHVVHKLLYMSFVEGLQFVSKGKKNAG